MLLEVRNREVDKVNREIAQMMEKYRHDVDDLQSKVTQASMEKERALASLQDCQNRFMSCKAENSQFFSELQEAKDNVKRLKDELKMEKWAVAEKDKLIGIMESHSKDNVIIKRLEEELQSKDKRHQAELSSLNDELKKVYKDREDFERRSMELENTVRDLQKKYNEVTTERAETVTRLMGRITVMEEGLEKRLLGSSHQIFGADTRARTDDSLRNELVQMESLVERLRNELTTSQNSVSTASQLYEHRSYSGADTFNLC